VRRPRDVGSGRVSSDGRVALRILRVVKSRDTPPFVSNVYKGKRAERENFLKQQLDAALGEQKFDDADKIRKQIASEKARLDEERDEEKERVRRAKWKAMRFAPIFLQGSGLQPHTTKPDPVLSPRPCPFAACPFALRGQFRSLGCSALSGSNFLFFRHSIWASLHLLWLRL